MRGDDVRRVRTERTEPAPRSATRDGPDATCVDSKVHAIDATPHTGRHGVGVVVVVDRLGRRRGRRSDGVEPLEGRARVPEPELDAGGLERRQRRARALRAPRIREQRAGAVVRDGVLRRLELRLFFHRERREARGERAAVEQFDEREAAAAPVRATVAAMASWRWVAAMAYWWVDPGPPGLSRVWRFFKGSRATRPGRGISRRPRGQPRDFAVGSRRRHRRDRALSAAPRR